MPLRVVPRRDRKLYRLVKASEVVPLRRGEVVWSRGDPADGAVLVRRGHLRLVAPHGPDRAERVVQVAGPWEMTGEEALLSAGTRRHGAVAGEVAGIQLLDARRVMSVLTTSTVTREAFLEAWLDDLSALSHLNAGSDGPDAAGRLASVLLHLARRLEETVEGRPAIPLQLTHGTLADLSGLHRSTVTTILNDWIYQGWISEAGRGIRLGDPDRLRAVAGLPEWSMR